MIKENNLYLDIYGFEIKLECSNEKILNNIKNDFSYFLRPSVSNDAFSITYFSKNTDLSIPKNLYPTKQSSNSMTYDHEGIRYNDYYGKALTILNYSLNEFFICSEDEALSYEIIFLIIQSRSGKFLDKLGIHKIHACSFSYNNQSYVLSLPSKGGKTTTLLELLKNEEVKIISDDSPLINTNGDLLVYPLRIGVENKESFSSIPNADLSKIYEFERQSFSKKYLLPITALNNKVEVGQKSILVFGYRGSFLKPKITKLNKFSAFKNMWVHMIIGIGLPMIIEYFIENTFKDYFINFKILISRIFNAIKFVQKSDCYKIELSSSIKDNVEELLKISRS